MTLPRRPIQHTAADRAVALVKVALPNEWVVREQSHDYGIDLEVELAGSVVSGRIFKGQVKSHQSIEWKEGHYSQVIRPETMNYWQQFRVPVVLFVVDNQTESVYWAGVDRNNLSSNSFRVSRHNILPGTENALALHVLNWIHAEDSRQTLYKLPVLARRLDDLMGKIHYDCFVALQDEEAHEAHDVYESIVMLVKAVGADVGEIYPWSMWTSRSKRVWGDHGEDLCWGTFAEMMTYIKSYYDSVIEKAFTLLAQEETTPENYAAKVYVANHSAKSGLDPFQPKSAFDLYSDVEWKALENELKKRNACLYPVENRKLT